MNDYTATAARLLPVAVERAGPNATPTDIVGQFWRLHDLAAGLGDLLRWMDEDGENHPITVRKARILSVGEPAEGVPIRWEETDRDGVTSERDANLGSPARNPGVRAVYDTARQLAGTGRECSLIVAYEPNDSGWETKDERGKTIRPTHFRRVVRIDAARQPRPASTLVRIDAASQSQSTAAPPEPQPAPSPQPTPEPVTRPEPRPQEPPRPLQTPASGPLAAALALCEGIDDDTPVKMGAPVFQAFANAWANLRKEGQAAVRAANDAAGTPVQSPQRPRTVGEVRLIAGFYDQALTGAAS